MDTTSLPDVAQTQLELARAAEHGRSAHTVRGGHEHALRQTVVGLRAGETLNEHANSREATLQVLTGRVRVTAGTQTMEAATGDLVVVPAEAHTLGAVEDSALLLTVALQLGTAGAGAATNGGPVYSWQEDWS